MPRIYLIYQHQLFADAIRAVLATQPGVELVGLSNRPEQIPGDVTTLVPDVILLEETPTGLTFQEVCLFLTNPSAHRLITLRSDRDGMRVWSQTWRQTVRTQDLMEAIMAAVDSPPEEGES